MQLYKSFGEKLNYLAVEAWMELPSQDYLYNFQGDRPRLPFRERNHKKKHLWTIIF